MIVIFGKAVYSLRRALRPTYYIQAGDGGGRRREEGERGGRRRRGRVWVGDPERMERDSPSFAS